MVSLRGRCNRGRCNRALYMWRSGSARTAPAYLCIAAMLCDVSVFMISITLGDITFSREDLDIMYLIIDNQPMIDQAEFSNIKTISDDK